MSSLCLLQGRRELGLVGDTPYSKAVRDSDYLVRRLRRTRVLEGHNGCVNTVAWNDGGTHLISGADDCHLNIYEASTGKLKTSARTNHPSNIFSAKFLPCSDDYEAVSCAGIGTVEYSIFTPAGEYLGHTFRCQSSITYQVTTTPLDRNEFLTCEEKGFVRLFDLRVKTSCNCDGCNKDVLFGFPFSVTSLAVHPVSPYYIACALGDGSVRLLDRRMSGLERGELESLSPFDVAKQTEYRKYRPTFLPDKESHKITSIQFNPVGSELLVSYSEDYLYLFNAGVFGDRKAELCRPFYFSHCGSYCGKLRGNTDTVRTKPISKATSEHPPSLNHVHVESRGPASSSERRGPAPPPVPPTTEKPPPTKRLRLRGDWSDTGPEARPEAGPRDEGGSLMGHMSRMFTQWIDSSLNPASELSPEERRRERAREVLRRAIQRRQARREETARLGGGDSLSGEDDAHSSSDTNSFDSVSDDDSFCLFSDSDTGPRSPAHSQSEEPTLSLTDALACCSTSSPLKPTGPAHSAARATPTSDTESEGRNSQTTPPPPARAPAWAVPGEHSRGSEQARSDEQPTHSTQQHPSSSNPLLGKSYSPKHSASSPGSGEEEGEEEEEEEEGEEEEEEEEKEGEEVSGTWQSGVEPTTSTDKSSFVWVPTINIVEGETDSDDLKSCDGSHDQDTVWQRGQGAPGEVRGEECGDCMRAFMRYRGHRNARTMIKQANFWGENWVMSGSDCGRVFVWDKWTGKIVNLLVGDSHVVNCIQPHPEGYVLATSGIDYTVKLWEPVADQLCSLDGLEEITQRNEVMLQESRNTITVPSTFVLRMLAYLNRRRRVQHGSQQSGDSDSD